MDNKQSEKLAALALGINDALIELTGALVGLSFVLKNNQLVALAGLITGVAAALSMGASAYMHARQEVDTDATITGLYTGLSYLGVVIFLVAPYFIFANINNALIAMAVIALVIIALMSRYSASQRRTKFSKEFGMMLLFSLGVAVISFAVGQALKRIIGVEV